MICSKCGLDKAEAEFYVRDRTTGQLRRDCKACVIAKVTASPSKVARHQRALERRAFLDARGPEDRTEYSKQYYLDHKDEYAERSRLWRAEHPEQWNSYSTKYAKKYPERAASQVAKRRARIRKNDARTVTARDLDRLIARWNGMCAYCRERPFQHMDHIVPIIRGGRHAIGNLLPSCAPCNLSKKASLVVEWKSRVSA